MSCICENQCKDITKNNISLTPRSFLFVSCFVCFRLLLCFPFRCHHCCCHTASYSWIFLSSNPLLFHLLLPPSLLSVLAAAIGTAVAVLLSPTNRLTSFDSFVVSSFQQWKESGVSCICENQSKTITKNKASLTSKALLFVGFEFELSFPLLRGTRCSRRGKEDDGDDDGTSTTSRYYTSRIICWWALGIVLW